MGAFHELSKQIEELKTFLREPKNVEEFPDQAAQEYAEKRRGFFKAVAEATGERGYGDIPYETRYGIAEYAFDTRNMELDDAAEVDAYAGAVVTLMRHWLNDHGWKTPIGYSLVPIEQWAIMVGGPPFFDALAKSIGLRYDELWSRLGEMGGNDRIRFAKHDDSGQPAVFLSQSPDSNNWTEIERAIATGLLNSFEATGEFSTREGRITSVTQSAEQLREVQRMTEDGYERIEPVTIDYWLANSRNVTHRLGEELKISRSRVADMLRSLHARGCLIVNRGYKRGNPEADYRVNCIAKDQSSVTNQEKEIFRVLAERFDGYEYGRVKLTQLPWKQPAEPSFSNGHAEALEAQYQTLIELSSAAVGARARGIKNVDGFSLRDLFEYDCLLLKRAETFCWFKDPLIAAMIAGEKLPDNVPLTRELIQAVTGWWYFTEPIAVQTTTESKTVRALLWSFVELSDKEADRYTWIHEPKDRHGIYFSTYIDDDNRMAKIGAHRTPTIRWFWPVGHTLAQAREYFRKEYQRNYGDGGPFSRPGQHVLTGEDQTLAAMETMSRFFMAGCLWLQQKILVESPGHIERHERKRLEKSGELPSLNWRSIAAVRVVQLRRRESVPLTTEEPGAHRVVNWSCRWLVTGHWRQQHYRDGVKAKWISGYDKGPADKPFRVSPRRVYVVSR